MAKSPEEMAQSMLLNLPEKTGKPLDEWLKILGASGLEKHGQMVKLLKSEHGVTHGFANLIAHYALKAGKAPESADDLVEAQYTGPKAGLRPIYDALIEMAQDFGDDVEISPKKTYVSLRRNKQFALIKPSTKTRMDLGINLGGSVAATERLQDAGSLGMVSHKVGLTEAQQADDELRGWLRQAYEQA